MKKTQMIVVTLFLILTIFITGCFDLSGVDDRKTEENKFIGLWSTEQGISLLFNKDGSCSMSGFFDGDGTWEIYNGSINITLLFDGGKNKMAYNYEFSVDDTVLTFIDAGDRIWVYSKQ